MPQIGSDADRLQAIQDLERAIQAKQPALQAAQVRRDAARQLEAERRKTLNAIEARIKGIASEVHQRAKGAYLNGQAVDRGSLSIGNEALSFSGWHGTASVPLQSIHAIDIGTSSLPARAGVPILGRLFPGEPRNGSTLLLTVREANATTDQLFAVADLPDAAEWASQIYARQAALSKVHAHHDQLATEREYARAVWQEADHASQTGQAELRTVEGEIGQLRAQQKKLKAQQQQIDRARAEAARQEQARAKKGGKR